LVVYIEYRSVAIAFPLADALVMRLMAAMTRGRITDRRVNAVLGVEYDVYARAVLVAYARVDIFGIACAFRIYAI